MIPELDEVLLSPPLTLSATQASGGLLILISRADELQEWLLFAGYANPDRARLVFLKALLPTFKSAQALDILKTRASFPAIDRAIFTAHILQRHKMNPKEFKTIAEDAAWRYLSLLRWGESAAAKVMAEYFDIPVRTVHTRLRMARDKGYLQSPGSGSRLNI
jgi:hypothetical protein